MLMRAAAAIFGLALSSALAAAAPTSGPAAVVDSFHSALRTGDTAAAAALLTDDALIFEEGGVERSKAEYAIRHLPADAEFMKTVSAKVVRRSTGSAPGLAGVASEGRVSGTVRGKPVERRTTETMILRQTERGWRIAHIHWSSGGP
jgi:ketosteroid isomerase-like protein